MPQNTTSVKRQPSIRRWAAPPRAESPQECLDQIRKLIESATLALLTPTSESLSRCEMCVRGASDRLNSLVKMLSAKPLEDPTALLTQAVAAGEELAQAYHLFQRAAQFHAGLLHIVSARRSGYTRTGSPARLQCGRKFVFRG